MSALPRNRRHESLEASTFACGTRSAYVRGCRCDACRAANTAYAREREQRRRDRMAELARAGELGPKAPPTAAVVRTWKTRSGEVRERSYGRPCPGVAGEPCEVSSYLRRDSTHGACALCRRRITGEGLVSADRARAHLAELARQGIGRRAVAAASDVAESTLSAIASGEARLVFARTERRILAVDDSCRADGALVPAGRAWRNVERLLAAGWSQQAIARALGSTAEQPSLQIRRGQVRLSTDDRLARLADRVERERAPRTRAKAALERLVAGGGCARCRVSHQGDPHAARWCLEHPDAPLTREERLHAGAGETP